jgi:UDP-N-acetylmuramate dehydrogenase
MICVKENENLFHRNSFGVKAKSRYWISFDDPQQLVELINKEPYNTLPRLFVGSGTNLLFTGNYPGCLLHIDNEAINILEETEDQIRIEVGAGLEWDDLVQWAVDHEYYGIENLSIIPGSVGAAAVQNIGAYGVELGNLISEVHVVNIKNGESYLLSSNDCQFDYRYSIFKNSENKNLLVWRVRLILSKNLKFDLSYGSLAKTVQKSELINLDLVRQAIISTRQSKLPDYKTLGNAGSFFKNPIIPIDQFLQLQEQNPELQSYSTNTPDKVKVPAAWMIEKAGWKGYRHNSAGVYNKQALVLVNHGDATGSEIMELAMEIRGSVQKLFGIELEPEVTIISSE